MTWSGSFRPGGDPCETSDGHGRGYGRGGTEIHGRDSLGNGYGCETWSDGNAPPRVPYPLRTKVVVTPPPTLQVGLLAHLRGDRAGSQVEGGESAWDIAVRGSILVRGLKKRVRLHSLAVGKSSYRNNAT